MVHLETQTVKVLRSNQKNTEFLFSPILSCDLGKPEAYGLGFKSYRMLSVKGLGFRVLIRIF